MIEAVLGAAFQVVFASLTFNSLKLVSILFIIEPRCKFGNIFKALVLHQAFLKSIPDLYPRFVGLNYHLAKQKNAKQKVIYLLHKSFKGVLNLCFAI